MSVSFKESDYGNAVSTDMFDFKKIEENRTNMTAFLSNAYGSLTEPTDSGKNIKYNCNFYYNEIVSSKGQEKITAELKLSKVYKDNSLAADGSRMSDEYINEIMKLNVSSSESSLNSLKLIVGDAVQTSVYQNGFMRVNGLNLLDTINNTPEDRNEQWVLALTYTLEKNIQFKRDVNHAIQNSNIPVLKALLQSTDRENKYNCDKYIDEVASKIFENMKASFTDSQLVSMASYIGNNSYVLLW